MARDTPSTSTQEPDKRLADRAAEIERFRVYRAAPSEAERAALVEHFAWVARHCARRFADRGEPFDDLLQVGMLGVLKAVDRFDPEHGSSFVSFALPTVLGELTTALRLARIPFEILGGRVLISTDDASLKQIADAVRRMRVGGEREELLPPRGPRIVVESDQDKTTGSAQGATL